jgi:branched-chain amino acid transport system substrate-binding protein
MKNAMRFMFAVAGLACFFSSCSKKEESNELRIGGIFSLSGDVAVYGMECRDGVDLAVKQINEIGGINGKQIAIITEDDEGNPEKTMNAYKKLTSKDGIKIIIGSLTSGCTKAIIAQAQAQKVLQIAPAATEPSITDAGEYIFRTCFIDPFQGVVGGKFSYENLGKRNAAILYDVTNDYCVGLSENFKSEFTKLGGVIVAEESYSKGDKDFNAQLTKIKQANPDVVVLCNTGCRINTIERKLSTADAAVVGTTFKRNGIFEERVDVERVAAFMEVVRKFRENL